MTARSTAPAPPQCLIVARHLLLAGCVQGVGLRPAVARWADELQLAGEVRNSHRGVEIVVEGSAGAVERFERELPDRLPTRDLRIAGKAPIAVAGRHGFRIVASHDAGRLSARVPRDVVACRRCLDEVGDPRDRRRGYPFTSCTDCGPRYSILQAMPYDRRQTSMTDFALCPACAAEYASPRDRRFHAQTNACAMCGPALRLEDGAGTVLAEGRAAIDAASAALREGKIVALLGLGGYQLLVDATSADAVRRLRQRKQRPAKPLAVMIGLLPEAEPLARLCESERRLLADPAGPIVVVPLRGGANIATEVHGGLGTVGLLLPTTPLHALLLRQTRRPLVATSGNREGQPLAFRPAEAVQELAGVADVWLHHNRRVVAPIDDSVARVIAGRAATIRLARGLAPWPLPLAATSPVLALGGHQKAALALSNGAQAVLGPHIGDLETLPSRGRFTEHLEALAALYGAGTPEYAGDLHPEYFTTRWARQRGGTFTAVQHHHAHIVAGMLEHGWLDRQVLGVAMDGTGWGPDGTIWGGEFLRCTAGGFQRVGHLRPFCLPGGEAAVRQPWRVAVALVEQALGAAAAADLCRAWSADAGVLRILRSPRYSPPTTSAGRLFDGIAALVLGIQHAQFEGQPAMRLEAACDLSVPDHYPLALQREAAWELDWRGLVVRLLADCRAGVAPGTMAMRFHRGLALGIARLCGQFAIRHVVLGGGVFQNKVLVELLAEPLSAAGKQVALPGTIPVNDGGLAAGQLAVVLSRRNPREQP